MSFFPYSKIARLLIPIDPLPDGALPVYSEGDEPLHPVNAIAEEYDKHKRTEIGISPEVARTIVEEYHRRQNAGVSLFGHRRHTSTWVETMPPGPPSIYYVDKAIDVTPSTPASAFWKKMTKAMSILRNRNPAKGA